MEIGGVRTTMESNGDSLAVSMGGLPLRGWDLPFFFIYRHKILRQLLTLDTLVPRSKKGTAKCDKSCELQNSVNHRILERK